jgi:hypothetical protein
MATPAGKVSNFCNMPVHFACVRWKRKKRHGNFSGNENRNARERANGKVAVVAGNKRQVFAKTNSCRETPDTDLDSNMCVNLAKPRPQSPCRRSTEGRNEESVIVVVSDSNADQNVSRLHEKVGRKLVKVGNSAVTESACVQPVDRKDDLHVDTTARELRVDSKSEWACATV